MDERISKYDVTDRELARGRNLKIAAWTAPVVLSALPAIVFFVLAMLFGTTPPAAVTLFFLGIVFTAVGFVVGLGLAGFFAFRYSRWSRDIREKMAADGIRAEELDWFLHELKTGERKALKDITKSDLLLADAYRETLASRLTATRIVRSSRKEQQLIQRRKSKLKQFKNERQKEFAEQIEKDGAKISSIHEEAKQMLAEAEARLQMIEAAAVRGRSIADSELALKKLSSRSRNLPLALEEARMTEEIVKELETELADENANAESETAEAKATTAER